MIYYIIVFLKVGVKIKVDKYLEIDGVDAGCFS
jgi:hypothetical protein